jgi:hypothetical protein
MTQEAFMLHFKNLFRKDSPGGSPGPDLVVSKSTPKRELSRPPTDVKYSFISRGYREGWHKGPMKDNESCRVGGLKAGDDIFDHQLKKDFNSIWSYSSAGPDSNPEPNSQYWT